MNSQKQKLDYNNLRVKAILASFIIVVGESINRNKDIIVYIPDKDLFERIVLGEDFEIDRDYLHELISMQKIDNYTKRRIDRIFNIIDSDPTINNEIPEPILNLIKEFIITHITLQQITNSTFLEIEIREIIQKEKPIFFIRLYFYLARNVYIKDILKIKDEEELDKIYIVLLKAYEILRELNPDQPKNIKDIVFKLKKILEQPEKIDLKIDPKILGLIKIPTELRELNKEKRELEDDLNTTNNELETLREMEIKPGELENDPEAKRLIELKKEKEKRLKEIEERIKELKDEWKRLISNKENT